MKGFIFMEDYAQYLSRDERLGRFSIDPNDGQRRFEKEIESNCYMIPSSSCRAYDLNWRPISEEQNKAFKSDYSPINPTQ